MTEKMSASVDKLIPEEQTTNSMWGLDFLRIDAYLKIANQYLTLLRNDAGLAVLTIDATRQVYRELRCQRNFKPEVKDRLDTWIKELREKAYTIEFEAKEQITNGEIQQTYEYPTPHEFCDDLADFMDELYDSKTAIGLGVGTQKHESAQDLIGHFGNKMKKEAQRLGNIPPDNDE